MGELSYPHIWNSKQDMEQWMAEQAAKLEAKRLSRLEAERLVKLEAERIAREESERRARESEQKYYGAIEEKSIELSKNKKYFGSNIVPPSKKDTYFRPAVGDYTKPDFVTGHSMRMSGDLLLPEWGDWAQDDWAVWDKNKRQWKQFIYVYKQESDDAYKKRRAELDAARQVAWNKLIAQGIGENPQKGNYWNEVNAAVPEYFMPEDLEKKWGWEKEVIYIDSKDKPEWDKFIAPDNAGNKVDKTQVTSIPLDLKIRYSQPIKKDNVVQRTKGTTPIRRDNITQRTVSTLR